MTDMREVIKRAIYDAPTTFDGDPLGTHLGRSEMVDMSTETSAQVRKVVLGMCGDAADAILSALAAEGIKLVKREPTEEMLEAAKRARMECPEGSPPGLVFARAFRAMIDVAPNY